MSTSSAARWQSSAARLLASAAVAALVGLLCAPASNHRALAQSAATPAPAAKETCVTCHVGIGNSYSHAPMRHAMEQPGQNPVLDTHPNLTVQLGKYSYSIQTRDGKSTYSVTDGADTLTLPIRWIFGIHTQTWVLEKDGHLYESFVSYFPRDNGLDITPGDTRLKPTNLTEAMGRRIPTWETLQCFNCHASGAVSGVQLTLDTLRPGLDCERCHIGANQHMTDAEHDNYSTLPRSLKKMTSEDVSNFCGQCHRTWDTVMRNHWKGPAFVRFQPYRLESSKCFIGNDPRISCLACHNPHEQLKHDAAFYDSKCLACHAQAKTVASTQYKACPVAKANCTSCHMPKVELPGGHAPFTDHWIRISHPGDPYPG